jgi:thymidylate synthase (FAD)
MACEIIWSTPNLQQTIVDIARVSTSTINGAQENLLKYLIKHQHWSPFEMANICVKISTTRAISAQIIRHRSFAFQEFSQRYSKVEESKLETFELRQAGTANRQSSLDTEVEKCTELKEQVSQHLLSTWSLYEKLMDNGVAKECARHILPISTNTTIYMNGSVRSWIHYLTLRTSLDTQKEHRLVAQEILLLLKEEFPLIFNLI